MNTRKIHITAIRITVVLLCLLLVACAPNGPALNVSAHETVCYMDGDIGGALAQHMDILQQTAWSALKTGAAPSSILPLPQSPIADADKEEISASVQTTPVVAIPEDLLQDAVLPKQALPEISLHTLAQQDESVVARYHVIFSKSAKAEQNVQTPDTAGYGFRLSPYAREMYVLFSTVQYGHADYLVRSTYAKLGDDWRLYEMLASPYASEGENAPMLLSHARQLAAENASLAAAAYAHAAGTVLSPCGITYKNAETLAHEIQAILEKTNRENSFPLKIQINSKMQKNLILIGAEPVLTPQDGVSLNLRYLTEVDNRLLFTRQGKAESEFTSKEYALMARHQKRLLLEGDTLLRAEKSPFAKFFDAFHGVYLTSLYTKQPKTQAVDAAQWSTYVAHFSPVPEGELNDAN